MCARERKKGSMGVWEGLRKPKSWTKRWVLTPCCDRTAPPLLRPYRRHTQDLLYDELQVRVYREPPPEEPAPLASGPPLSKFKSFARSVMVNNLMAGGGGGGGGGGGECVYARSQACMQGAVSMAHIALS